MEWYLDCFLDTNVVHRNHPVNTYYHEDLEVILDEARKILTNRNVNGIAFIRIGLDSDGQAPMQIEKEI